MSSLSIWAVYDHPKDYPYSYIAREFRNEKPTENIIICQDLEQLRHMLLVDMRLTCLASDDPCIVETWL